VRFVLFESWTSYRHGRSDVYRDPYKQMVWLPNLLAVTQQFPKNNPVWKVMREQQKMREQLFF
jgi:hypothetical protein